jgi:hypothetical protein
VGSFTPLLADAVDDRCQVDGTYVSRPGGAMTAAAAPATLKQRGAWIEALGWLPVGR